jgi:hypothetical protein
MNKSEILPSFRKFDYSIRQNKGTERRMLNDVFRKMSNFEPIENYRYIGFGSVAFTDFIVFHKNLNITDMISIEKKKDYEKRFEFNRPYRCIDIKFGSSTEILPKLEWKKRTIVWLDYDGKLDENVLQDIAFLTLKSLSGSILLITVNAEGFSRNIHSKNYKKMGSIFLSDFNRQVGRKIPSWVQGKDLEGDEMSKTLNRMIFDEISANLRDRNGLLPPEETMNYVPLFNFVYRDNAPMLTVGGIFYKASEEANYTQCHFEDFKFITGNQYGIRVPVITLRERHFLNRLLPDNIKSAARETGLTLEEIDNYSKLYRYSPSYAEIEI